MKRAGLHTSLNHSLDDREVFFNRWRSKEFFDGRNTKIKLYISQDLIEM